MSNAKAIFTIGDFVKTSKPGRHVNQMVFKAYAPDRSCVLLLC